jgi:hypothetical protein
LQQVGVEKEVNEGVMVVFDGPAQTGVEGTQCNSSSEGGSEEQQLGYSKGGCEETEEEDDEVEEVGNGPGPMSLRTRNGDLPINGPPFSCPSFFAALENLDDEVEQSDPIESFGDRSFPVKEVSIKRQKSTAQQSTGETKKPNVKMNLNNLPFNMLRKLPGGLKEVKKRKSKKLKKKRRDDRHFETDDSESSASIQSFDEGVEVCTQRRDDGMTLSQPVNIATEEFELEVVLPFHSVEGPSRPSRWEASGVEYFLEGGGFIEEDYKSAKSQDSDDGIPISREFVEAKKLIALNVELGVKFNDGDGEDVGRMMGLEVRDRAEKNDWENSRGYQ